MKRSPMKHFLLTALLLSLLGLTGPVASADAPGATEVDKVERAATELECCRLERALMAQFIP